MRIRFAQPSVTPSVERKDCRIRVIHSDERDNGRGERIRTSDPLVPNQVLYQAEPLPERRIVRQRAFTPGYCR
jgi:hypothetical protein